AAGHVDGQGLMPGFDERRAGPLLDLLPGQRFPHRRPFRARRRHDVVDPELSERLQDGLAAIDVVSHLLLLVLWLAGPRNPLPGNLTRSSRASSRASFD